MFCFVFVCISLELAHYLQKRMAPCKAGVQASCRGTLEEDFLCRDPQFGTDQLLELLAARTGDGVYLVEVCRQGKCDNARLLQKAAVRQASVWVRCIRLWPSRLLGH